MGYEIYTIKLQDITKTIKANSLKQAIEKLLEEYRTELMYAENCDCYQTWESKHKKLDSRIRELELMLTNVKDNE